MKHIIYTIKHKIVFAKTEKKLIGKYSLRSITHDLNKLILYCLFVSDETVTKIHRKYAKHHENSGNIINKLEAVIDWECARITKPEKPLNARQTYEKYYLHIDGIYGILNKLKL